MIYRGDTNNFQGSNNEKIELIMLSSTSFDKLEPLQKAEVNETSQDYEQVDGFESLREICTIHIIYGIYNFLYDAHQCHLYYHI